MNKEYSDGNSAVEKQQKRTEELFNKVTKYGDKSVQEESIELLNRVKSLCAKHSELIDDFEVVKEMNKIMSERFDEVVDKFPLLNEVDKLLEHLDFMYSDPEEALERKLKLQSFRKIVEALDKNRETIKPKSYEDSVETQEVKDD